MQEFYQTQTVLVRHSEYDTWNLGIFDKTKPDGASKDPDAICFMTLNKCVVPWGTNKDGSVQYVHKNVWCQCIPYEGNELLLGTSYDPNDDRFSYKKYVQKQNKFENGETVLVGYDRQCIDIEAKYIGKHPEYDDVHVVLLKGVEKATNTPRNYIESYRYVKKISE